MQALADNDKEFLSTSPARGTTMKDFYIPKITDISIHVPREGDDVPEDAVESTDE